MFKVNNKIPKRRHWPCSSVSIVNFQQVVGKLMIEFTQKRVACASE